MRIITVNQSQFRCLVDNRLVHLNLLKNNSKFHLVQYFQEELATLSSEQQAWHRHKIWLSIVQLGISSEPNARLEDGII
jgi:hypothetical protein